MKRVRVDVSSRLDVERDVLSSLPSDFLWRYTQVWLRAFGGSVGGKSSGGEVSANVVVSVRAIDRTSTSQVSTRGGAKSGKKLAGAAERGMISSEAALTFKRKVDAGLRKLNREMKSWLVEAERGAGGVGTSLGRRCSSCKRFGDEEWLYCPWDGKPMEERDA